MSGEWSKRVEQERQRAEQAEAQRDRALAALRKIAEHPADDFEAMRWLARSALAELEES